MAQSVRAILLASAIAASFFGLRASRVEQPGRPVARLGEADHRRRTEHDQLAQGFVALPADAALPTFAARGIVLRGKAEPRSKMPPGTEGLGVGHPESKADGANWPDPGLARQTLAHRVFP